MHNVHIPTNLPTPRRQVRRAISARRACTHQSLLVTTLYLLLLGCDANAPFMVGTVDALPSDEGYVEAVLAAKKAQLPMKLDRLTELTDVSGTPQGFSYDIRLIHSPTRMVDHNWLTRTKKLVATNNCQDAETQAELNAGLNIQYTVHGKDGAAAGRFFITQKTCRTEGL